MIYDIINMEKLIELVSEHACLYDTAHPDYCKKTLKKILWKKIARQTSYKNGQTAKQTWMKLRSCHRDAIRRRNKATASGESPPSPGATRGWKFEKQMEFLLPYMTPRGRGRVAYRAADRCLPSDWLINCDGLGFDATPQGSETMETCPPLPPDDALGRGLGRERRTTENNRSDCDSDDDLHQFFIAMYKVTKKMPALTQHHLKRKIFNLVSDEEEALLTAPVVKCERDSPNELLGDVYTGGN